jgi:hypothetical protein
MVVLSVPARVRVLLTDRVLPLVTVRVPVLLVMVRPLTLVAVAAPMFGVVSVGLVANTLLPDPVFVTETRLLDASVATALDAVRPVKFALVVVRTPVDGLNWSLVDDTSNVVSLPVVTFENVMYRVALVVVSSVIVTPETSLDQVGTPEASFRT